MLQNLELQVEQLVSKISESKFLFLRFLPTFREISENLQECIYTIFILSWRIHLHAVRESSYLKSYEQCAI